MRKSLFKKYLRITSFIILISFVMLGLVMLAFVSDNWQSEKRLLLGKNAQSVAGIAASTAVQLDENNYGISDERLQMFMQVFSENIDADILVTDVYGSILYQTFGNETTSLKKNQIDQEIINRVLKTSTGRYVTQGTLGGLYDKSYYVVGVPINRMNADGSKVVIGAVFTACSARAFGNYRLELMQVFLLAAVAVFMVSFCIVWIFSYKMVHPLREMSTAAKAFGEGNFSVRVGVTTEDEIGQMALAFNNMAASLSSGESVRRNFIANVSHELKTPMTTIAGFIDGILDGTIPREKQDYYLHIVSGEVKRLSRLVRTMLDLSRIDNGELRLRPGRFDVTNTILMALLSFEKSINDKKLEIRGLENVESLFVDGDPDMIHQVLYNLIENAVKFTNETGYIELTVSDLPDRVNVRIRNSGAGIPAGEVSLIFERFYKTDKSRSKDKTGMGLGLYIVRTIIKLHGGEITVSSVENEYCQFEFWLPKLQQEPALKEGKENGKD